MRANCTEKDEGPDNRERHDVEAVLKQRGRADRLVTVSVPVGVLEEDRKENANG